MSYFDGPNRIMSVMNVPVELSKCGTPRSMSLTKSWNFGSSSCSTVSPEVMWKYSYAISASASIPEFDLLGSVWPRLTNPQAGLPPIPAQPLGELTALRMSLQVSGVTASEPAGALTSTLARSSQTTNTSGVSTSGCGARSPVLGNNADWFLVFQSAASR